MDIGRPLPADVTRDLLDELLVLKSLYEVLNGVVRDAVIELDGAGRIVRFNAAAEQATGHSATSLVGRDFGEIVEGTNAAGVLGAATGRDAHDVRFNLLDSGGSAIDVLGRVAALTRAGEIEGWLLSFTPQRKIAEIEQLKNELVGAVSHELKTPLASIKAYTATLRGNPALYQERGAEFLEVVEEQADRLGRLIDDMLLVTRVDAEYLLRSRSTVPIDDVLDRVDRTLRFDPSLHRIVRDTSGVDISGDPERLEDIFRNLLENAIKYSPRGGTIAIAAERTGDRTVLRVRDEGVGIPEDCLPYVFDRFYRVESELTQTVGGNGLGLFIVNALVRAHGGSIDVRSELGRGTTVTLSFPMRP